jgi:hypothetical protein
MVILIAFVGSALTFNEASLTWQRTVAFALTWICLIWGLKGAIFILRHPYGEHPTVFPVSMFWQKLMFNVLYLTLTVSSLSMLYPEILFVPERIRWMLYIATSAAIAFVNIILGFSNKGWVEQETDMVPFRSVYRALKNWRSK